MDIYEKRNEILDRLIKEIGQHKFQQIDNNFLVGLCFNAAIGLATRDARKLDYWGSSVEHQLGIMLDRVTSMIEDLKSGNVFAQTEGVDYELIRDYLKLNEEEYK